MKNLSVVAKYTFFALIVLMLSAGSIALIDSVIKGGLAASRQHRYEVCVAVNRFSDEQCYFIAGQLYDLMVVR